MEGTRENLSDAATTVCSFNKHTFSYFLQLHKHLYFLVFVIIYSHLYLEKKVTMQFFGIFSKLFKQVC